MDTGQSASQLLRSAERVCIPSSHVDNICCQSIVQPVYVFASFLALHIVPIAMPVMHVQQTKSVQELESALNAASATAAELASPSSDIRKVTASSTAVVSSLKVHLAHYFRFMSLTDN